MRYGVILRAVNVGRHDRVRMDVLRAALEAAGCQAVRSYLQTGDLTLDADVNDALVVARHVEATLAALGLRSVSIIGRPWADVVDLAAWTPFGDIDGAGQGNSANDGNVGGLDAGHGVPSRLPGAA